MERFKLFYFGSKYYLLRCDGDKPVGITVYSTDRPEGSFGPELGGEVSNVALLINLQILSNFQDEVLWLGNYRDKEIAVDQMKTTKQIREELEQIVEAYSGPRVGNQKQID